MIRHSKHKYSKRLNINMYMLFFFLTVSPDEFPVRCFRQPNKQIFTFAFPQRSCLDLNPSQQPLPQCVYNVPCTSSRKQTLLFPQEWVTAQPVFAFPFCHFFSKAFHFSEFSSWRWFFIHTDACFYSSWSVVPAVCVASRVRLRLVAAWARRGQQWWWQA